MNFTRFHAVAFAVGSLTITACPDDTPMAGGTEGGSGSSGGADDGSDPTITTGISSTPSTMSVGDDTTGSPTTDPGSSSDGGDGGSGDCCSAHPSPSCSDDTCSNAVCAMNASCCAFEWDGSCVELAEQLCDGCTGATMGSSEGDGTDSGSDDGGSNDQCCVETPGMPGCPNQLLEDCVCGQDPFCCDNEWDGMCVGIGTDLCGADCPAMEGDCCVAGNGTGCLDDDCEMAVCAVDSYCCNGEWDGVCAAAAAGICETCGAADGDCCSANGMQGCNDDACVYSICDNNGRAIDATCCTDAWTQACADSAAEVCQVCGGGIDPDDCCAANGNMGCGDETCEAAVCAADPFCCTDAWDENCAAEAAGICTLCGGVDGECCGPTGTQGCNDDACVVTICGYMGFDSDCCTNGWTQACANAAADSCEVCSP